MKGMSRRLKLNHANSASSAHSWLVEQVYGPKRERTIELVKRSIEALLEQKERVSLASIVTISQKIDPEGQGISESAILGNDQARAYYEQNRSWKGPSRRRSAATAPPSHPGQVKPDRNLTQVRQRYLRMGKAALVDRLLVVEQTYAEQQERWLVQQDELLHWRLRAEQSEAQLQKEKATKAKNSKL
jgi:hypothetical protein